METKDFEKKLEEMKKPEVFDLAHQDMLANAIIKAKNQSVLSWWWLSVPLYIIAALLMKTCYMPNTTLSSNIHELATRDKLTSGVFFLIVPLVFIGINFIAIRRVYFLSGKPKNMDFLSAVWFNVLVIMASVLILVIYTL